MAAEFQQDDNRIRVKLEPEMQPVRYEDRMDLNSEIDVGVDTHMKGLGVAGLVAIAAGVLCILVGAIFFILGYPQDWIASISDTGKYAASRALIERVVLFLGFGITLLFFGVSAFFYGRTVLGSGHLDQFSTKEVEVET
jgi:hypothetical protein